MLNDKPPKTPEEKEQDRAWSEGWRTGFYSRKTNVDALCPYNTVVLKEWWQDGVNSGSRSKKVFKEMIEKGEIAA